MWVNGCTGKYADGSVDGVGEIAHAFRAPWFVVYMRVRVTRGDSGLNELRRKGKPRQLEPAGLWGMASGWLLHDCNFSNVRRFATWKSHVWKLPPSPWASDPAPLSRSQVYIIFSKPCC